MPSSPPPSPAVPVRLTVICTCAAVREGMLHAFYGCRITVFTLRDFEANFFQRGHCFGSAPRPTAETTEQPVRGLGVGGLGRLPLIVGSVALIAMFAL